MITSTVWFRIIPVLVLDWPRGLSRNKLKLVPHRPQLLDLLAPDELHRVRHVVATAGHRFRLRLFLPFSRREEQVGFQAMLLRVQIPVTPPRLIKPFVRAPLDDPAGLYH